MSAPDRRFGKATYAELKALTRQMIDESFGSQKTAAAVTRVGQATISDYCSTGADHAAAYMPIDVLLDLIDASGDTRLLKALAERCNCLLVPMARGGNGEVGQRLGRSAKEFGDVLVKIGEAIADGSITEEEERLSRAEILEVIIELSALAEAVSAARGRGTV